MNFRHLVVFIASLLILTISSLLLTQVFDHSEDFITELLSLYGFGAAIGCGLAVAWHGHEIVTVGALVSHSVGIKFRRMRFDRANRGIIPLQF